MAAVVDEEDVAGARCSDQIGESTADVPASGLRVGRISVDQDGDVVLGEVVAVDQASVHAFDVVDASFELGLCARIVAADQHCLLGHERV